MPVPILDAFARMMPRLQAAEQLDAIEASIFATPVRKRDEASRRRSRVSELQMRARGDSDEPKRRTSSSEMAAMFGAAGIQVEKVPARTAAE